MPLIKCPECGHLVSDRATECPKCGYPMAKVAETMPQNVFPTTQPQDSPISLPESRSRKPWIAVGVVAIIVIAGLCVWLFGKSGDSPAEDSAVESKIQLEEQPLAEAAPLSPVTLSAKESKAVFDAYSRALRDNKTSFGEPTYFLSDVSGDNVPELWIFPAGTEAESRVLCYTVTDGRPVKVFDEGSQHSTFYEGERYLRQVTEHMGYISHKQLYFSGSRVQQKNIFEEQLSAEATAADSHAPQVNEKPVKISVATDLSPLAKALGVTAPQPKAVPAPAKQPKAETRLPKAEKNHPKTEDTPKNKKPMGEPSNKPMGEPNS